MSTAARPAAVQTTATPLKELANWLQEHLVSRLRPDVKAMYFAAYTSADGQLKKAGYSYNGAPVEPANLEDHVLGKSAIGCYLMDPKTDGQVSAAVVDLDDKKKELTWLQLCQEADRVATCLIDNGLLPFAVRSGSGHGIHLWLLWATPQHAGAVREALKAAVTRAAVTCHIDIFPAQDKVGGGLGNLVALPFARASRPIISLSDGTVVEDLIRWSPVSPGMSAPLPGHAAPAWADDETLIADAGQGLSRLGQDTTQFGSVAPSHLAEALGFVDASDFDIWKRVALALKVAAKNGQLSDEAAFKIWDDWSRTCVEKYDERANAAEWTRHFKPRDGGVTLGTIWHMATKAGWNPQPILPAAPAPAELIATAVEPPPLYDITFSNRNSYELVNPDGSALTVLEDNLDTDMGGALTPTELEDLSHDPLVKKEMGWLTGGGGHEIDELNRNHFIARDGGKVHLFIEEDDAELKRRVLTKVSVNDFKIYYQNHQVLVPVGRTSKMIAKPLGEFWLDSAYRRQYRQIVMEPGPQKCQPWQYNLWQGWSVQPKEVGSWKLLHGHILENVCRGDLVALEYVLNWLAFTFQKPTKPIGTAIVLRGNKGTGKSMFVKAFGSLFAKHFTQITNSKALTGTFNSHLRSCIMLFADEAVWAGSRTEESTLKAYITEPTIMIEGKGKDAIACRNMLHVIIATNHDWAAPASLDERRFCCLNVNDAHQGDMPYFKAIQRQLLGGGSARLLHDMLTRDISKFDPQKVPMTDELTEQKLRSLPAQGKWWLHRLEEGTLHDGADSWVDDTPAAAIYQDYVNFCQDVGDRNFLAAPEFLSKWLADMIGRRIEAKKGMATVDGVRKKRTMWKFPPLHVCRNHFTAKLKAKITWNTWPEDVVDGLGTGGSEPQERETELDF